MRLCDSVTFAPEDVRDAAQVGRSKTMSLQVFEKSGVDKL
jgi:hypothetical protein